MQHMITYNTDTIIRVLSFSIRSLLSAVPGANPEVTSSSFEIGDVCGKDCRQITLHWKVRTVSKLGRCMWERL